MALSERAGEERERENHKSICIRQRVCLCLCVLRLCSKIQTATAAEQQQSNNNKWPHTVIERVVGERVPPLPSSLSSRQTFQLVFAFGHNT